MGITAEADKDGHYFWKHVGGDVYDKLTDEQRKAVLRAARRDPSEAINSDIRLSFGRYFLVVLFGKERRSRARLNQERVKHPVFVAKNLPVLLFLWGSVLFTVYSVLVYGVDLFARGGVG